MIVMNTFNLKIGIIIQPVFPRKGNGDFFPI